MKPLYLLLALSCPLLAGKRPHYEAWYQAKAAKHLKGKTEVVIPNGRVDILTTLTRSRLTLLTSGKTNRPSSLVLHANQ